MHNTISVEYSAVKKNITVLRKYVHNVSFISTQISVQLNQNHFGISRPHNKRGFDRASCNECRFIQMMQLRKFYVSFEDWKNSRDAWALLN